MNASGTPQRVEGDTTFGVSTHFFEAVASRAFDQARRDLAEDVLFLMPGLRPVQGRARVLRMLARLVRRFDDVRCTCTMAFAAEPDWQVSTWTIEGTVAGSGVPYGNEMIVMMRLDRDGRVAYLSNYFKSTDPVTRPAATTAVPRERHAAV